MSEAWFYQRGDQRLGPVSSQELKRLADTGELQPTDLLWKEGMPKPLAASRAKGLFSAAVHQEATTPPSAASPAPPPLPADDMPLPSQQPDPDLTLMRGQDTLAVAIPASFDKKQLAQKIQQLRHDVIQNVLGGEPSLPSSPLIDSIRAQHWQLQDQIGKGQDRIQQLSAAKVQYEPLEKAYAQKRKELAGAESQLEGLAKPLGHAAYQAHRAGEVGNQPCFADRIALQGKIEALHAEYGQIAPPSDASLLQKTKAKAQQLVVAGKIKIEELKIGSQETQIGKSLLDSSTEQSVACATTTALLDQVSRQRATITELSFESEAARTALDSKKHEFCATLRLSCIENAGTFDAEIRRCKSLIGQAQKERAALEHGIPDRLVIAAGEIGTPLAGLLGELWQANEQMALLRQKGGSWATIELAGLAALDRTRQFARAAVNAAKLPHPRGVLARMGARWRNLGLRRKMVLASMGFGAIVLAIIAFGLSGQSESPRVNPGANDTVTGSQADLKEAKKDFDSKALRSAEKAAPIPPQQVETLGASTAHPAQAKDDPAREAFERGKTLAYHKKAIADSTSSANEDSEDLDQLLRDPTYGNVNRTIADKVGSQLPTKTIVVYLGKMRILATKAKMTNNDVLTSYEQACRRGVELGFSEETAACHALDAIIEAIAFRIAYGAG